MKPDLKYIELKTDLEITDVLGLEWRNSQNLVELCILMEKLLKIQMHKELLETTTTLKTEMNIGFQE